VVCSFLLEPGPLAAVLVAPFVVTVALVAAGAARQAGPLLFWRRMDVVRAAAHGWAMVAAGSLVVSRLGWTPFGQTEPIVELTAVHYLYAGVAAITLAGWTGRVLPLVLTGIAPPFVALGFLTGSALPQVGGALVMALGVCATAVAQLSDVFERARPAGSRVLLAVSSLSIWVPMVLAVAWAAGQHWNVPAFSIPAMARTHGAVNAAGFVLCGLAARRSERRSLELARQLEVSSDAEITYDNVGRTLADPSLPCQTRSLGQGTDVFDAAVRRLQLWTPQRRIGARILPTDQSPRLGATILLDLRLGPLSITVPNRIVAVVDEPRRWGFAYGTLPGHHERGEESFVVTHHADDSVTATITVDARPASTIARFGAPLVRCLQRAAIRRYLEALA
jgi:uncharacterized protein (UPF0548 family)